MFSLFRKSEELPTVPEWADFFNPKEYSKFSKSLDKYFNSKNMDYQLGEGYVEVTSNDFSFNQLRLSNVAQLCKLEGIRKSDRIVRNHFEGLIRSHKYDIEFNKIVEDFDNVRQYIGVRLYNDDYIDQVGKELVLTNNLAPGIHEMLIFDLPESVTSVQPQQIENWGLTIDELFDIGRSNIKSKYKFKISKESFEEFKIWFVQADHFFTPNILLEMSQHSEMIGTNGSLIGAPHRHCVIIYPIESLDVVKAINKLIPTIHGMNEEGPGSLSSKLYWYQDDQMIELPYDVVDNQLKFQPPESFLNMLNSMGQE